MFKHSWPGHTLSSKHSFTSGHTAEISIKQSLPGAIGSNSNHKELQRPRLSYSICRTLA